MINIRISLRRWAERREPQRTLRRLYWGRYIWTPFVRVHAAEVT